MLVLLIRNSSGTYTVRLDAYDSNGVILANHVVPVTSTWDGYKHQNAFVDREWSIATNQAHPVHQNNGS